jgi:hypothetical protein
MADSALYRAKGLGRNSIECDTTVSEPVEQAQTSLED